MQEPTDAEWDAEEARQKQMALMSPPQPQMQQPQAQPEPTPDEWAAEEKRRKEQEHSDAELMQQSKAEHKPLMAEINNQPDLDLGQKAFEVLRGAPAGLAKLSDAARALSGGWAVDAATDGVARAMGQPQPQHPNLHDMYTKAVPPRNDFLYNAGGDFAEAAALSPLGGGEAALAERGGAAAMKFAGEQLGKQAMQRGAMQGSAGALQNIATEGAEQYHRGKFDPAALARDGAVGFGAGALMGYGGAKMGARALQNKATKQAEQEIMRGNTANAYKDYIREVEQEHNPNSPFDINQLDPHEQAWAKETPLFRELKAHGERQNQRTGSPFVQGQNQQQTSIPRQAIQQAEQSQAPNRHAEIQNLLESKWKAPGAPNAPLPPHIKGSVAEDADRLAQHLDDLDALRHELGQLKAVDKSPPRFNKRGMENDDLLKLDRPAQPKLTHDEMARNTEKFYEGFPKTAHYEREKKSALDRIAALYKPNGAAMGVVFPGSHHLIQAGMNIVKRAGAQAKHIKLEHLEHLAGSDTTSDIIRTYANPEFMAGYERRIFGQLSHATQVKGFEVPSTPQATQAFGHALIGKMTPEEVMNAPHLSDAQKVAIINIRSVLDEQAQAHREQIAQLDAILGQHPGILKDHFGLGLLRDALRKDLSYNLDRSSAAYRGLGAAMAHGMVNGAVLGKPSIAFMHMAEGLSAAGSQAPIQYVKANAKLARFDKLTHDFADMFTGAGSYKQMEINSPNPVSRKSAEIQKAIWDAIPGTKNETVRGLGDATRDVISGRAMEVAKMKSMYATAGGVAAKEMGYKDADQFMREYVNGTMSPDNQLMATIKINQNVNKWIGSTPLGYRDMTSVDRAAEIPGFGGLVRLAVPFTRAALNQRRMLGQTGIRAIRNFRQLKLKDGAKEVGSGLSALGALAMFSGSKAVPQEILDVLPPEKRQEAQEHLEKLAIIGDALGTRFEHLNPSFLPLAKSVPSGGMLQSSLHDVQTLADNDKTGYQRVAAGAAMVAMTGLSNIADTVSPEVLIRIAQRMDAMNQGASEQFVYKEPGVRGDYEALKGLFQKQKVESGFIAHGSIPLQQYKANSFIANVVGLGTAKPNYDYKMQRENEHAYEEDVKNHVGPDVFKEFKKVVNEMRPAHAVAYKDHLLPKGHPDKLGSKPGDAILQKAIQDKAFEEDTTGPTAHAWQLLHANIMQPNQNIATNNGG